MNTKTAIMKGLLVLVGFATACAGVYAKDLSTAVQDKNVSDVIEQKKQLDSFVNMLDTEPVFVCTAQAQTALNILHIAVKSNVSIEEVAVKLTPRVDPAIGKIAALGAQVVNQGLYKLGDNVDELLLLNFLKGVCYGRLPHSKPTDQ